MGKVLASAVFIGWVGQLLGLGNDCIGIVLGLGGLWEAWFCGCSLQFIGACCWWLGFKGTVNYCFIGGECKDCI